ncbi:MAG: SpaA isopeptide-forming pilin-related protein [bacterium]|nr:SpaA isopeptide-forming pilin-related protein [bacterium]
MLKKLTASLLTAILSLPLSLGVVSPLASVANATAPHYTPTFGVDKDQAKAGDTLTYTYNVKNDGQVDLTSVFLAGNLSNYITLKPGTTTATKGSTSVTGSDAWITDGLNLGGLKVGQSASVTFKATVKAGVAAGSLIQTVMQSKTNELPNWIQCAAYTNVGATLQYKPSKSVDKATATIGDTLTYTLKVKNSGDLRLHDVSIAETLPTNVDYIAGSTVSTKGSSTVNVTDAWIADGVNLGSLEVGQTATVVFKVKVSDSAKDGDTLQNVGHFTAKELPNEIQCAALTKVVVPSKKGYIKVIKFEDFNGNGVKDGADKAPKTSFTFRVVGMGLDFTLTTNAKGTAVSGALPVGSYTVTEKSKAGWTATTAKTVTIEVENNKVTEVRFGNKQAGKVLPTELPNTGPELFLLGLLGIGPAGLVIKKLKSRI